MALTRQTYRTATRKFRVNNSSNKRTNPTQPTIRKGLIASIILRCEIVFSHFIAGKKRFLVMSRNQSTGKSIIPHPPTATAQKEVCSTRCRSLQGYQNDWEDTATSIREDWKAMTSACALYYNGDMATVICFIGGRPHVNQHINIEKVPTKHKPVLTTDVYNDVHRILTTGAPVYCNAEATHENFDAYLKYRNHKSAKENPKAFESTIIKQSKRGLTLIMDPALVHFTLNTHLTPQGLVDILHHRRKPRPVSDCSFRPWAGANAINDWTSKVNEPALHFADSFHQFCIWHWYLAISYPKNDRHTGDDDVQCAFPRVKYNPNLVQCTAPSPMKP